MMEMGVTDREKIPKEERCHVCSGYGGEWIYNRDEGEEEYSECESCAGTGRAEPVDTMAGSREDDPAARGQS